MTAPDPASTVTEAPDLTSWLSARYDEAEKQARAATPGPWRHDPNKHWRKPGTAWFEEAVFAGPTGDAATCIAGTGESDDPRSMVDADHIAAHDPSWRLADIARKRQILAAYEWAVAHPNKDQETGYWVRKGEIAALYETVLLLAAEFADAAGYQEGWKP